MGVDAMVGITPNYMIAVLCTIVLGLAIKPTSLHPAFFVIALSIFISIIITPHPDFDPGTKYHVGLLGSHTVMTAFNLLVLESDPQNDLKHNRQVKSASELGFFSRLGWAATLLLNVRGANWNFSLRGLRPPKYKSRFGFVMSQLMWIGLYYLLQDLVGTVTRNNPALSHPPTANLSARGLGWQAANVVLFWVALIAFQDRTHMMWSVGAVALGLSEPEDWPAYFGVWWNTTSLRAFWGRSWHQCLRRSFQPQSKFIIDKILYLPSKGLLTKYTELFLCFFLSGIYHAVGDWVVQRNPATAVVNVKYFISQAIVITVEDSLIFIGKQIGIAKVPTVVSYAWTLACLAVTCPSWIDSMMLGNNFQLAPNVSMVAKLGTVVNHILRDTRWTTIRSFVGESKSVY